jgi:site-specific recombinase XerD
MKVRAPANTDSHRFLLPNYVQPYLDCFANDLSQQGYTLLTIEAYYESVAHFSSWLYEQGIPLKDINDSVIATFAEHRCHCPGGRRIKNVSRKYVARVRRFISYLHQQVVISDQDTSTHNPIPVILIKFKNFLHARGLASATVDSHMRAISELLPYLGNNPDKYDQKLIHQVICNVSKKCSIPVLKSLTKSLRAYLRFLTIEDKCPPHLEAAVPSVAQWNLSSLPKYLTADELERVITASNIPTKQGLRDHAILLLLGRLGLRAGDVINMCLDDINWDEGTIRLCGKGRKESLLPLPQEVGNALLLYLEKGRPPVPISTHIPLP